MTPALQVVVEDAVRSPLALRAAGIESALTKALEIPVAGLVIAEIAILFTGVVARYVFHQPLIWSDELAAILFLWLAMLGSAVAFQRGEHMRMTAVFAFVRPGTRALLDILAVTAALAFLLLMIPEALNYAHEEILIRTPALDIPNIWRAAALPAGMILMIIFAFLRVAADRPVKTGVGCGDSYCRDCLCFLGARTRIASAWESHLLIFFVGVVAGCVFAGVPIAFAFAWRDTSPLPPECQPSYLLAGWTRV